MTCDPLAYTGAGQLGLLLTVAIACLAAGALLPLMTRRRGSVVTGALLLLVSGAVVSIIAATPTPAVADDCPSADHSATENSFTITQTSVIEGLAPGIMPVAIAGIVVNNATDSTYITAVDVEIAGVITEPGAVPGVCDASDYVLLDSRMQLGRTLGPGGSTPFAGASIGFSNKSTNQDVCKGATIQLLYTANPN